MRIGLLGFAFSSANKGCEALTYSFISILHQIVDDESLEIVNYYYSTDLGQVPNYFPDIKFEAMNIKLKDIHMQLIKSFKTCDVIIDITLGDNFSDIYSPKFVFKTTLTKEIAILSGTPLILAPQTYGPFNSRILRDMAGHVIKKSMKVYSRDLESTEFIKSITGISAKTVTDVAFLLPFQKQNKKNSKKQIGINVSGLLWNGGFAKENQFGLTIDYKKYVRQIITILINNDYDVHIIPHVIDDRYDIHDDDWHICCLIKDEFADVILAPKFATALEAKNYICNMDVFIGGRMHSTIAAFSSGVATIPFSYSRKFEGLYGSLHYPYLIHGTTDSLSVALKNTIEWVENSDKILKEVITINKNILSLGDDFVKDLKSEIERIDR